MVGHVAYAMYKRDKLAFCEQTKKDAGREATVQEIEACIRTAHIRVELYRIEATQLLGVFAQEVMAGQFAESIGALKKLNEDKIKDQENIQKNDLAAQKLYYENLLSKQKKFGMAVLENVVGGILTTALTALVVLILILIQSDGISHFANLLGFERKPSLEINQKPKKNNTGINPSQ